MSTHHHDDHGHSLAEDLTIMEALIARRRALKWFAGAGTAALVAGCGAGSESSGSVAVVSGTATATPTPTPTPTATATPTPTATASGRIVDPTETSGPYPADGTNSASGSTSHVLTTSGIVRSDIRSSFISTSTVATGVQVQITLTLTNVNASCAPLCDLPVAMRSPGALFAVYRRGRKLPARGAGDRCQRPGHVHDDLSRLLRRPLAAHAFRGVLEPRQRARRQILDPDVATGDADRFCSAIYADTTTYAASATTFAKVSLSSDLVFGDNTAAQIAQQTPTFTGSIAAGYAATALIGIAR